MRGIFIAMFLVFLALLAVVVITAPPGIGQMLAIYISAFYIVATIVFILWAKRKGY